MSAKEFYSDSYQMTVSYEFIPRYNTYGIVCENKNNEKFYYINCSVRPYGSSADINGMSSDGGGNFGFRLYEGRLSVQGEIFYLKGGNNLQNGSNSNQQKEQVMSDSERYKKFQSEFSSYEKEIRINKKEIMKFQDWMDINNPNWVNGKNLNKSTGYGSWGPSTQEAWEKYKYKFFSYTIFYVKYPNLKPSY